MTSPSCDLIYGFVLSEELTTEEMAELREVGLYASPLIYTLEDTPDSYIVGKLISATGEAGETIEVETDLENLTANQKQEITLLAINTLNKMGYDIDDTQESSLVMNSYYA